MDANPDYRNIAGGRDRVTGIEDPIGFAAGDENLRRYVGNGVTNAIDPLGLEETVFGDIGYWFETWKREAYEGTKGLAWDGPIELGEGTGGSDSDSLRMRPACVPTNR